MNNNNELKPQNFREGSRRSPLGPSGFLLGVIITLGALGIFALTWVQKNFQGVTLDMMIMQLRMPLQGTQSSYILSFFLQALLPSLAVTAVILLLVWVVRKTGKTLYIGNVLIFPNRGISMVLALAFLLVSFGRSATLLGVPDYLANKNSTSDFIERNYIPPTTQNLVFPQEKRNLVYIYIESLESTFLSIEEGGQMKESVMPELAKISQDNVSFSDHKLVGGAVPVPSTGVTSAAMVGHTSGLPLYLAPNWDGHTAQEIFIDKATNLGDILADYGYAQYLMVGSHASFGARDKYYNAHGGTEIIDLKTAWKAGIVPDGYDNKFWGMEDMYLYEFARQELPKISTKDEPFCFTMLTTDTHFPEGYKCELCRNETNDQYLNAFSCASRQVNEFLDWLKEQDFYSNTTVIIVGDHLTMSDNLFYRNSLDVFQRRIYNAYINLPQLSPLQYQDRMFSVMDFFPTTLAAIGVEIEGDRLGLGTNLFSDKPTLLEMYGYDFVHDELNKNSDYYTNTFISGKN